MVIIVFGLPGTGKTYFAKHLAVYFDAVHLSTDIIRAKYHKMGRYDEETKKYIYQQLKKEMTGYILNGQNVVVDGTFHNHQNRKEFAEHISALKHNLMFIRIQADEQIIKKRLSEERKYSEADYEVYKKIKKEFEPFGGTFLTLSSENNNLNHMLRQASQYIHGRKRIK